MRALIVNSEDRRGGAARAAHRLHLALRDAGVDARMLVQVKHGDEASVLGPQSAVALLTAGLRPAADLLPLALYRQRRKVTFYPGWLPGGLASRIRDLQPDVVHFHWITGGAVDVRSFRSINRPLVWTLHDMWAFTGGCHYDEDCGKFASRCGRCPVLGSNQALDLSSFGWRRKQRGYRGAHLTIVAPSRWLGDAARGSPLLQDFPVIVIPNPIDTAVFRPIDKQLARQMLNLPPDQQIILFGALRATSEPRKGFPLLQEALQEFSRGNSKCFAVIFGASQPSAAPDFGMPSMFLGTLNDDVSLALLYSAADVFVAPSRQENLSNTVLESLSCGTPVVAFSIGGMPDMIDHQRNGYLAQPFDAGDLARGLEWVLNNAERAASLAQRAREKALEEFDERTIAKRYLDLYQDAVEAFGLKR
jgi:glycosyltransferase involved in cell wall biosynthesis